MAAPARYFDLIREMRDAYNHRLRLVESVRQRGIKPTARLFLALRRQLPTFGAARLKREFDLPLSHMAIQRIWRAHGLIQKRRKANNILPTLVTQP